MDQITLAEKANHAIEEPINFHINRPLAAFFVDYFYKYTKATPNQVTVLAMLVGIVAGVLFSQGTRAALFVGAIVYQLSLVLDCVDGQLARLKKMNSEFGRILDGAGDYVVGFAVFGGALIGMHAQYTLIQSYTFVPYSKNMVPLLLALSFFSITIHSIAYDYLKTKFGSIIKSGVDATEREHLEMNKKIEKAASSKRSLFNLLNNFLLRSYVIYGKLQRRFFSLEKFSKMNYSQAERVALFEKNRFLFRLWSWLGPNSHFIWIVLAALMGDVMLAAFFCIIPMNIYFLFLVIYTKRHFRS